MYRKYGTGRILHVSEQRNTQQPTPAAFPSLVVGRAAAPSNHGAAAPQRHAQAVRCWTLLAVVRLLAWGVEMRGVKK